MKIPSFIRSYALYVVFAQALLAMLGSLYFSEIMKLPPCVLCWYQRIALYPIVLLAGIAIWHDDRKVAYRYLLPLASIGLLISVYQNLLYYKILPETIQPCTFGISCTAKLIEWGGFITIPLLALIAFVVIVASLLMARHADNNPS